MNTLQITLLIAYIVVSIALSLSLVLCKEKPTKESEYEWRYLSGDMETEILSVEGTIITKSKNITVINRCLIDAQMKIITKPPKPSNN